MERRISMASLKYSRQRESIKEFLMTRTDHPTADTVYHQLRKIYPNISLGTVTATWLCWPISGRFRRSVPEMVLTASTDRSDLITMWSVPAAIRWWIWTWITWKSRRLWPRNILKERFWDMSQTSMASAPTVWKKIRCKRFLRCQKQDRKSKDF